MDNRVGTPGTSCGTASRLQGFEWRAGNSRVILTIANTKGGVGKTTLALNIAIRQAIAGKDVWLVDGDRQATASNAIAVRADSGRTPSIACSSFADGIQLRSQVLQQSGKFEEVIIDVGGRDSSALRAALVVTDMLLVPFQPRSFDVWALADIAQLVREARSVRDGLKAFAVLNFADATGSDNREAAAAASDYPDLIYLDSPLHRRKAFANATGAGLCVSELKPIDFKADAELTQLLQHLYVTDHPLVGGDMSVTSNEVSMRHDDESVTTDHEKPS